MLQPFAIRVKLVSINAQLERVQQWLTQGFFYPDIPAYEGRLYCLSLPSLSVRRKVTDFVLTYNLLHGLVNIYASSLGLQLTKNNTILVSKAFKYRIASIGLWKSLPVDIKIAKCLPFF